MMRMIQIKNHFFPIYLTIILLVITPLNPLVIMSIIFPLLIVSISIYLKKQGIGIIGMFLFYILSISQITISTIDEPVIVYSLLFIVIAPSLLLLYQILNKFEILPIGLISGNQKTPVFLSFFWGVVVFVIFYAALFFLGNQNIFSSENIQGQILLFSGISLLVFTPLLIKQKNIV